jgi:hypothetical protein
MRAHVTRAQYLAQQGCRVADLDGVRFVHFSAQQGVVPGGLLSRSRPSKAMQAAMIANLQAADAARLSARIVATRSSEHAAPLPAGAFGAVAAEFKQSQAARQRSWHSKAARVAKLRSRHEFRHLSTRKAASLGRRVFGAQLFGGLRSPLRLTRGEHVVRYLNTMTASSVDSGCKRPGYGLIV